MQTPATVSVVVPAYNAEHHIGRAIDSILAQTSPASEIVVVDDGSSDGTGDVVKGYGPRVTYVRQNNAGASMSRNHGIEVSQGRYIAFLDADDEWLPDRLERTAEVLKRCPELAWVAGRYTQVWPDGTTQDVPGSEDYVRLLTDACYFPDFYRAASMGVYFHTCAMTIRKDALLEAGLFDSRLRTNEDRDMWYRIADLHPAIGYVNHPLFKYIRAHEGTLTTSEWSYADDLLQVIRKHVGPRMSYPADLSASKAAFFRGEIKKTLKHVARTGQIGVIRAIHDEYGGFLDAYARLAVNLLRFLPSSLLVQAGRAYRALRGGPEG